MKNFPTVKSEKTSAGYVGVPRVMGLTKMEGGKIELNAGRENGFPRPKTGNTFTPYSLLTFLPLRRSWNSSDHADSSRRGAVLGFLKENLNVEWTTFAQVNLPSAVAGKSRKDKAHPSGYIL
jgi:hypothetical protein